MKKALVLCGVLASSFLFCGSVIADESVNTAMLLNPGGHLKVPLNFTPDLRRIAETKETYYQKAFEVVQGDKKIQAGCPSNYLVDCGAWCCPATCGCGVGGRLCFGPGC